jgi:hypothetical protein
LAVHELHHLDLEALSFEVVETMSDVFLHLNFSPQDALDFLKRYVSMHPMI